MSVLIALQKRRDEDWNRTLQPSEIIQDPEALLERIRRFPGQVRWVAIAPDLEDPTGIARRIREANPNVGVVLLAEEENSRAIPSDSNEHAAAVTTVRSEPAHALPLLQTVDAVILLVSLDGTVLEWNRRAESLCGVSREEARGRPLAEVLPEEEPERVGAEVRRLAAGGKSTENFESAVRTAQGIRHVLWNATLVDEEAERPAVLATGIDVTEQRHTEQILRETRRRKLEAEKLASITSLTAGLAHDLGTPITTILGYAELLAKSVDDEKNRKRATTIVEQAHRVSGLIETLMNMTRTEERPAIPLELAGVLDKALDFYREKFDRRGIEVQREYGPAPQVLGDPDRLRQVLLNLLLNAIEAMPQGGTIRVSLAETDSAEVEIRLSDTGRGIDSDLRAQIFEPDFAAKQPASGTGLALLVAKTIVEEQGGRIDLISEPERGNEFRLTFPRLPEAAS